MHVPGFAGLGTSAELARYEQRFRPFWSLPTRFGIPELAVFVLVPALLAVVTQGQVKQFFGIAFGNLVLVRAVSAVVGYGLIATTYWGLRRLAGEMANSVASLVRALPLLLVFSLVLFVNADMWRCSPGCRSRSSSSR